MMIQKQVEIAYRPSHQTAEIADVTSYVILTKTRHQHSTSQSEKKIVRQKAANHYRPIELVYIKHTYLPCRYAIVCMIMHVMFYVDSTSILPTGKSVKSYAFGENSEENSCTRQHFSPTKPLHERHLNKKKENTLSL